MKFIIKETGEHKTLEVRDVNGYDFTEDMIGNSGAIGDIITREPGSDEYLIGQEHYDWWDEYIQEYERFVEEYKSLCDEYGEEEVEDAALRIDPDLSSFGDDYETHKKAMKEMIDALREELAGANN